MILADLITQAATRTGDQKHLATALGVTPQRITEWKNGHRPCPLATQARIAELAGEDPKEWVWQAVCRQMGRATAAVLLALAAVLAASVAPGAGGASTALSRRR